MSTGFKGARKWAELHKRPFLATFNTATETAWLESFQASLPCGECKSGWMALVKANPPDLSSPLAYFKWGWRMHNLVRVKLGQTEMPLDEARSLWAPAIKFSAIPKKPPQWRVNRGHAEAVEQLEAFNRAKLHVALKKPIPVADLKSYFDRVVVISLERTPDRLKKFRDRLSMFNWPLLPPAVLPATDGLKDKPPPWWREGGPAWGCLQSHRRAITEAISANTERLFIMEDDAAFAKDFGDRLREFLRRVPGDWDCLMIGGQQMHDGFSVEVTRGVMRVSQCERTHCFALSRRGMKSLLEWWSRDVSGHCDWQLGDWQARPDTKCYRPDPVLSGQAENFSTIRYKDEPARAWDKRIKLVNRRPIYAVTTAYDTAELLPHFIEHYAKLGVDRVLCVTATPFAQQTELSQRYPVTFFPSNSARFTNLDKHAGEEAALDIAGVLPDEWVMRLDLDEFHQYPAHLHDVVAAMDSLGVDACAGKLFDRIAANGTLAPIRPSPDIGSQYPIGCWLTPAVRMRVEKIMLARRRVRLQSGRHWVADSTAVASAIGLPSRYLVHHFRWVDKALGRLETRYAGSRGSDFRGANLALLHAYEREGRLSFEGKWGSRVVGQLLYPDRNAMLSKMLSSQRTSWEIDDADRAALFWIARKNRVKSVVEFGPGRSTLLWAMMGLSVTSYESDPARLSKATASFAGFPNVSIMAPAELPVCDMAFVDGPRGTPTMSRADAARAAAGRSRIVVVHDAKRDGEKQTLEIMRSRGHAIEHIETPRGLAIINGRVE